MKNWKRLLSTVLAAALFMTQPGAVGRGASAAADAVSTAAQYMAEAVQNVMIPLPTGAVVRAAATYSIANDTAILKYDTSGVITGFEITNPDAFDGHLEIPASIKDVTITSIAENAFSNNAELLSVVIPDSVTAIGDGAFSACFSLTAVDLPAGLTVLNNETFQSCEELNSITLPENLTAIGQGAFMYCTALTEISIPDNVTVIGNATFQGCTGLHTVNGGSGLQTIGQGAFSDCTALTNIILPNSLTVMGEQAFYLCSSLESIDIPDQLTEIPSNAFQGCTKLAIVDFGQVKCIGMRAFTETGLTQLELPNTVEQIGDSAFSECLNLSYAVLPDSVTQMGEYLFEKCSALENVQLPAGIKLIESATFLNCANLQSIQIPEGVDTIESDAFLGCTALTSVLLPSTLKAIEEDAFFRCTALKSVILPEGVATVGKRAFGNCFNLASVTVNGSTTSFGDNVLEGVAEDFTLWVLENSTALQYAVDNRINYRIIGSESETRTLSVAVQTPQGETLSEGFSVNWYEAEETTPIASGYTTLSNADPDKTYEFEIILEDSLLAQYEQPERQEIKPDDPASVTVTLTPVSVLTLTGEVEDSSGELLADVSVLVELETDEEGEPSHAGTTGEDGKFSLTVPALYAQVSLQKDGYYTKRIDIAPVAAEGGTYDLGVLQLTETVADRINLTLQASRAVPAGETAALQSISPDSSLQFSMTGADGQPITGFEMQGTALLFQPNEVEAKETITLSVTDRSGRYADAQAQVTLNEHKVGSAALVLQERGSFRLGTVSGENARVLVFGSDGTLKNRFIASSGLQGDPMPAGSYTLVYLQNSSLLPSVPTLARLDELGLRAGTDYVQQKAAIQDGVITVLSDVKVPALDTETLVRTQATGTVLFSSTLTPGMQNPFYLQVNYLMQEGTGAQASTVQVCLPEGLALLDSNNNVFVNGVISRYTENNGTIEVPVSGTSASVIVYCYAEQAGSYDVSAYLTFTDEAVQPVGTVSLTASNATISVTDRTSSATIPVSGKAMPRAEVTIYDNGVQVGTATANAVGSWSTTIELQNTYDYSYHFVHAETGDTATNEELVIYDSQPSSPTPELQTITMRYVDTKPNVVTLDFQKNDTIVPNYYITFIDYIGSTVNDKTEYAFTFQVKFDRNDLLESVYVLTESASSDTTCIETTYDEATQTWVGVHVFDGSTAPVSVCAAYRLNDSAGRTLDESQAKDMAAELYEQMEQAASAVELEFDYTLFEDGSGFALLDDEGTPFLNYTVAEEADTRTADELVADGFYPIAEDEAGNYTVFSKAEYSDTVIQETYVDTVEHLQVTETMQMVQDQTIATSMLARIESIDAYDTMDNIVSWAGFIPGYGSLVDLTSGLVHLVGDQVMWRQTLKGNRFILNNKLDTLRAILESDCPDGSYRVPNTVYQQMISNISDIEAGIEQYGRQAETYINMSIGTFAMQQVLGSARGKVLKAGANAVLKRGVKNVQKYKALQQKYIKDKILGATRLEIADQWQSKVSDMAVTHLVDQNGGEFSINRFGLDVLTSYGIENYIHGQCASLEEWIDDCIAQVRASLRDCDTPPNDPSDYDHTTGNQDDYHHTTGNQSDYDYTTDKKTLRPLLPMTPRVLSTRPCRPTGWKA